MVGTSSSMLIARRASGDVSTEVGGVSFLVSCQSHAVQITCPPNHAA
jgi:hypothetical protein